MKKYTLTALAVSVAIGGMGLSTAVTAMQRGPQLPSFEELDTNSDGVLTQAEIEAIGAAKFAESDTNGDGFLDAKELQAKIQTRMQSRVGDRGHGRGGAKGPTEVRADPELIQAQQSERLELAAKHMLQRADTDGDGQLSLEESRPPQAGDMFARVDADGNGEISLEEWDAAKANRGNRNN